MKSYFEELYISITGGRHFCRTEQPREFMVKAIMRRSIRNINIPPPPPGQTPGIWTFEDWVVQIPAPWAKIAFKYPTLALDLTVKCPS